MARSLGTYLVSAIVGSLVAGCLLTATTHSAPAMVPDSDRPLPDCVPVSEMFLADQADRYPEVGAQKIDWASVDVRDAARRDEVRRLYRQGKLRTGNDYYRAAVILQHGKEPEDFLLAHDFAIVAVSLGRSSCRWLIAATEDRFLLSIGRRQRFGTQFRTDAAERAPRLYPVDGAITDGLRQALDLPTLSEVKEREAVIERLAEKGQV